MISIYRFSMPDPIEREQREIRWFNYFKAKIEAEHLNPESDYDGEREKQLLLEIALSDLGVIKRNELVRILGVQKSTDDE